MIEAIIHVNNRTQYLERAVEAAVISANAAEVLLRISCNASELTAREEAGRIAERHSLSITFSQSSSAFEHFYANVASSESEHVCLLHDDDFVCPQYFEILQALIASKPGAAGYASDTKYLIENSIQEAAISPKVPFKLFPSFVALLYLIGRCGPSFPSIVYRRDFAVKVFSSIFSSVPRFCKYSDAAIVICTARAGLWIHPDPAFTYFIGMHNDSRTVDQYARKNLRYWLLRQLFTRFRLLNTNHLVSNFKFFLGRFIKRHSKS